MNYTYEEVIYQIQNTKRFGHHTGAEVSACILEQLGNPQHGIPFVHIAGTNGKGSTTAFLCNILEQAGKKVGMFTSPHLVHFEERIRINGCEISREDVRRLGNVLLNLECVYPPTMFDYCLAMAVLYFAEQKCDVMVMETGIGGRHDSTNALGVPKVAVITKIGLDHTALLGDTLEQIAYEKAGILKPGSHVVMQMQQEAAAKVIRDCYRQVLTEQSSKVPEGVFWEITQEEIASATAIPKRLLGTFQNENAAAAIRAACLFMDGDLSRETIEEGISRTVWKGRMELVNTDPFFLIDGAHNAHGVHALAQSLRTLYPGEKFHFIMGVMADKDYEDMIAELLPLALDFVTVTPESNRALQAEDLAACIVKQGIPATFAPSAEAVIAPLLSAGTVCSTGEEDCEEKDRGKTVAFGSLYFIGGIEAMI